LTDNIFRRIVKSAIIDPISGLIAEIFPGRHLSVSNFLVEVAKGNVAGHSVVNKFGHNPAVLVTGADIWSGGGYYDFFPTSAVACTAASTDDEDGGAGGDTGALTMQVYGLDTNWEEQTETVILNGTTVVNLSNNYIRLYRAIVLTAGSNNTNIGDISVSGGGDTGIFIAADDGQTQQTIYTIPNEKTGYFLKGYVGTSDDDKNGESASFKWKSKANNGVNGAWATKGQIGLVTIGSSWWQYEYGAPAGPLPEKTDIRLDCFSTTATLGVVGGYDLLLVDDGY